MDRADLQLLWEYNTWTNSQMLAAAAALTALGASPGELDFTVFLSRQQPSGE